MSDLSSFSLHTHQLLLSCRHTFYAIQTRFGIFALDNRFCEHLEFPETDGFSHTFFGKPWIAKEWLSQVLLALAFEIGGWPGVVMLTAGTYAAIAAILTAYLMSRSSFFRRARVGGDSRSPLSVLTGSPVPILLHI